MLKILCVCLGNICRSPTAEGILRSIYINNGYKERKHFVLDSAGTSNWHLGSKPDRRSIQICSQFGVDITQQQARQLESEDGGYYDYILAMDDSNIANIKQIIDPQYHSKILLFDTMSEVDDPYFGDDDGFLTMYKQLQQASFYWLAVLKNVKKGGKRKPLK